MNLAILGASGRLGDHLTAIALSRGHQVRALSRYPRRIKRTNELLTVFRGNAETGEGLEAMLEGARHVVWAMEPTHPARCMQNVLAAIGRQRIERFIYVSWLGAGDSAEQARRAPELLTRLSLRMRRRRMAEVAEAEALLHSSTLPHVVLRSTLLTNAPSGGRVVVQGDAGLPPRPVGRADLARFLLRMIEERAGWSDLELTVGAERLP
jgi:uncharacterized protein YbjT (DUF2867 family)